MRLARGVGAGCALAALLAVASPAAGESSRASAAPGAPTAAAAPSTLVREQSTGSASQPRLGLAVPDAPLGVSLPEPALVTPWLARLPSLLPARPRVPLPAPEAGAEVEIDRELLESVSGAAAALVPSCPPPALLGCNSALQLTLLLDRTAKAGVVRKATRGLLLGGLRAAGYRRLRVGQERRPQARITVRSEEEVLGRAALGGSLLRIVIGGSALPPADPALVSREDLGLATVEIEPAPLAQLIPESSPMREIATVIDRFRIRFVRSGGGVRAEVSVSPAAGAD